MNISEGKLCKNTTEQKKRNMVLKRRERCNDCRHIFSGPSHLLKMDYEQQA